MARIPLGLLADRYDGRLIFTGMMLVLTVPVVLAGLVGSYGVLLAISFFIGVAGASFAVGVPFVSGWFPAGRQGTMLGIYGMGNIGTAFAGFLAPRLADSFGIRWVFWIMVPALVIMAIVFWFLGRDAPVARRSAPLGQRLAVFRREPVVWVLALFYFVTFGGFVAMSVYLPTLLVGQFDLLATDAATRPAGFVVLATLARPLGGFLADRRGAASILNVVFPIVAAFAVVLAFEPGLPVITVAFLGTGIMLGVGSGVVFKLVPDLFPRDAGTVTGLVGAAGGLGGFFPPLVMGIVHDVTGSYAIGYMLLSEFALLSLIVNILVIQQRASIFRPRGEHPETVESGERERTGERKQERR